MQHKASCSVQIFPGNLCIDQRIALLLKGKEIIEYYLKQLREEGIVYIPRWTPPVRNAVEHRTSHGGRTLSSPIKIPETAIKEGLIAKDNTCNSAADPMAGTPDGALLVCCCFVYLFIM